MKIMNELATPTVAENDKVSGDWMKSVNTADFFDIDVPVVVTVESDGNGIATRETGFSLLFSDIAVASLHEGATANPG